MLLDVLIKEYPQAQPIKGPGDVLRYCRDLKGLKKEAFLAIYLDTNNGVIAKEVISIGTLNAAVVHPRELYRTAIVKCANAVIIVHNHPSGRLTPSDEDRRMTRRLKNAGDILGIRLLDHLLVSEDVQQYHCIGGQRKP